MPANNADTTASSTFGGVSGNMQFLVMVVFDLETTLIIVVYFTHTSCKIVPQR